ncbi:MAG: type II toxin-antitoxin system RelE/ParE family toxin [Proteobacteria bacterium]|jgi:addiction module RelE/StbE family toxin|nr:type II toxin-antitoxin system RelE/ParE family toxin [Pseudomonadota bacterium]
MAGKKKALWTGPALRDLEEMRDWISRDNPTAARRLAQRIRDAVRRAQRHPESGRVVPELAMSVYRETIVSPYRIIYTLNENALVVLRVWHGKRDFG